MDKLRFDASGYSAVVKNKGSPPNAWSREKLSGWEIEPDMAVADLFSNRSGR